MLSSKKFFLGLVPLAAVLAFALVPAMAQAAPEWLACLEVAKGTGMFPTHSCVAGTGEKNFSWVAVGGVGAKLSVQTHATELTFSVPGVVKIDCAVKDEGFIWNTGAVGQDEVTAFVNEGCVTLEGTCVKPELLALTLPWKSHLVAGPPVKDVIEGITIDVNCNGALFDTFTGTLSPTITEANGTAVFSSTTGTLEDSLGNKANVTGEDFVEQLNGWAVTAP